MLREAFGEDVINSYIKLKRKEIEDFDQNESFDKKSPVTEWEKNNTLDCQIMSANLEVTQWKYSNFLINKNSNFTKNEILKILSSEDIDEAYKIISNWNGYSSTPLISLNKLNEKLKLNKIYYKDESKRFHLKSFKALGGAYAVEKIIKGNNKKVISTATAGNHGRSVAWGSQKNGLECKIFISEFVSEPRAKVMRSFGADVIRVIVDKY